jgi:hypothetical protein
MSAAAAGAAAAAANQMSFRRYEDHRAMTSPLECRYLTHLILIGNERHGRARYVLSNGSHNLILTPRRAEAFGGGSADHLHSLLAIHLRVMYSC